MTNFEIYTYLKSKNGGGEPVPVPVPVTNPALRLIDWEGTVLKEYTAEQVASLTALPNPSSLNANVDRELLTFQEYNWNVNDIKAWVLAHSGDTLVVGAIYTTTDGQDHTYRNNPRINTNESVSMLKKGTTSIATNAFNSYYSLTNVNLPDGVINIGYYAFYNCYSLTSVNLPDSVTSIANYAFSGCCSLTNVNIPDSVTSIGAYSFNGCYSLTSVNIPDGVISIGVHAFEGCYSLTNVNIPDGVTSIVENVFYNCRSLTSVNLPDSVTSIASYAFSGCSCLTDIVIKGSPDLANVNAFSNIYSGYLIYVPRASLSWYSTATNWITLYNNNKIVAIEDNIEYLESLGIDV